MPNLALPVNTSSAGKTALTAQYGDVVITEDFFSELPVGHGFLLAGLCYDHMKYELFRLVT
jgi:hypothetical protein